MRVSRAREAASGSPARPQPGAGSSRNPLNPVHSALLDLQQSAGNRAVAQRLATLAQRGRGRPVLLRVQRCGPTPCDCSDEERADYAARQPEAPTAPVEDESPTVQLSPTVQPSPKVQRTPAVQRNADDDLADYIAKDLATYAASHKNPYAYIRDAFRRVDSDLRDNIAADFVQLQTADQLELHAGNPEGRALLDYMSEAMLTGHVTSFETLQANRILSAKGRVISPEQHQQEAKRIAGLRHEAEDSLNEMMVDRQASAIAQSLVPLVTSGRYATVTATIRDVSDSVEDNIAAHLVELLTTPQLEAAAKAGPGRVMLDVCYDAVITGSVTPFERLQGDRILAARLRGSDDTDPTAPLQSPTIFPLATGWGSTATIVAGLQANGTVKVYYDTRTGARQPQFRRALDTLSRRFGDATVFSGMILRPDEVVMAQLFDADGVIVPIAAIQLVDFFNQQQNDFVDKVTTITMLGATAGLGGIGGAGLLGWADTVAFAISAGSVVVKAYRREIAKTAGGRLFLEAWDVAEGVANLYGWGRLGVDGLRLVQAKVAPALRRWRAEGSAGLSAAERNAVTEVQATTDAWLDGVKRAEATEVAKAEARAADGAGRTTGEPKTTGPNKTGPDTTGAGEPSPRTEDLDPGPSTTGHATPGSPKAAAAVRRRKVAAGGQHEIHVTNERVEVCPIQRCPPLDDVVKPKAGDPKVAEEAAAAEKARAAGDATGAAEHAELALINAHVAVPSASDAVRVMTQAGKRLETQMWELELRIKSRRFREGLDAARKEGGGFVRGEVDQELRDLTVQANEAKTSVQQAAQAHAVTPDPDLVQMATDEVQAAQRAATSLDWDVEALEKRVLKPPVEPPRASPPSAAERALARDVTLSVNNPAVVNRQLTCRDYIAAFREPGVVRVFPTEYLAETVETALRDVASGKADSVVRKMLVDGRFAK